MICNVRYQLKRDQIISLIKPEVNWIPCLTDRRRHKLCHRPTCPLSFHIKNRSFEEIIKHSRT